MINWQLNVYWKLLDEIANGGDYEELGITESFKITPKKLNAFIDMIEDPVWRKRNIPTSNLVPKSEAEEYRIALKRVLEVLK